MNNYQKLLLKLNKQLEKYRDRKESLEKRKAEITGEIAEHQEEEKNIENELKKLAKDFDAYHSFYEDSKKEKIFVLVLLAFIIIYFSVAFSLTVAISWGIITFFAGVILLIVRHLYFKKKTKKEELTRKNDNQKLLAKKKELNEELDRIRNIIASLRSSVQQIQYDIDRIDTVISRLEADINYIVEQENIAIAKVAEEQEPKLNASFDSNERLRLIRGKSMEADNDESGN